MKKNYIFLTFIAVILTITFILPAFITRISQEQNHNSFTIALDIGDVISSFGENDVIPVLNSYIQNGVSAISADFKNSEELNIANETSLPIALTYLSGNNDFYELNNAVKSYNVRYIILKDSGSQTQDKYTDELCELISENDITLVLKENLNQLSNEMPQGFDFFIESSEGRILRCYETLTESYATDESYPSIYYQMLNSAVDRNTEFILLNQLEDSKNSFDNASRTMNCVKLFSRRMEKRGFTANKNIDLSEYKVNIKLITSAISSISVVLLLAMYMLISGKNISSLSFLLIPAAFLFTLTLPEKLLLLYPTAFSVLAPCFCFTLCYRLSQKKVLLLPLTALFSLSVCSIYMCTLLSGRDFYINTLTFRGVIVTLIIPVIFAGMQAYFKNKNALRKPGKTDLIICLFAVVMLAVYLIRSGNTSISEFERLLRDRIVDITFARPRTKEFLLGWPMLMLLATFKPKKGILSIIVPMGSAVLFSSVTNSFCHVFTDAVTIYQRTLNGFLFSLPIMVIIYAVYIIYNKKNNG